MDATGQIKKDEAKRLIRQIVAMGAVLFTSHARRELEKDGAGVVDALNVLRAGWVGEAEYENGFWRYRVETPRFCVIAQFRSETALLVITAWRKK